MLQDTRGQFVYRAPQDGEFWFALRTVDRQGQLRGGKMAPSCVSLSIAKFLRYKSMPNAEQQAKSPFVIKPAIPLSPLKTLALSYQINGQGDWRPITLNRTTLTDPRQTHCKAH